MIGSFFDSFGKEKETYSELPKEVIDVLNKSLPDIFSYIRTEDGRYVASLNPEKMTDKVLLTTLFEFDKKKDAELISKLKIIPPEKWIEYFYRIQKSICVKNSRIGNKTKQILMEEFVKDPLSDEDIKIANSKIIPECFPKAIRMIFESIEGDKIELEIQQKAYDSLKEIKFENINYQALKMEIYQYSPLIDDYIEDAHTSIENTFAMKCSVTPTKASNVREVVSILHIVQGIRNGTVKVNGHVMTSVTRKDSFDDEMLADALDFWENVLKIEEILKVTFDPKKDCTEEDIRLFIQLKTCLIERKTIIWHHPFNQFHVSGVTPIIGGFSLEDSVMKASLGYEFLEGPILVTFLGTSFNLYSKTEMKNFIITNIEWKDDSKKEADIFITDSLDEQWTLSRLYITDYDAKVIDKNLN